MHLLRLSVLFGLLAAGAACATTEDNVWPVRVSQLDAHGEVVSWQAAGPLFFSKPSTEPGRVTGFRPLFARWETPAGQVRETNVLYPFFSYRRSGESYRWSVFQLVNRGGATEDAATTTGTEPTYETFDVWPLWFSRDTGEPAGSYRALFPIAGTMKSRFGYDRLSWTLFPLYGRAEKKGAVSTSTPWPFVKITRGTEQGFALWPLYGHRQKPGVFEQEFYLWPLAWNNTIQPREDAPAGSRPRREVGLLPFYTSETETGFANRNYLWPFFGYTDRTTPVRYHETRYLWPFLVQGRGDQKYVNRWGPFYTHSNHKGTEKTWIMWPFFRERTWTDAGLQHEQRQMLYFLYRSTLQRSATNPNVAPAEKAHLWPLLSAWDNGAGRKQFQFPSPLEVFFPDNERIRVSWSPLFALYRYDQRAPDTRRHELLWGFISWNREPDGHEFHLGPLFSVKRDAASNRVALGNGIVTWQRNAPAERGRFRWFDFSRKEDTVRASAR